MLQQNTIREIENISHLTKLVKINLSNNLISKIENLQGLDQLQTLDLSCNIIPSTSNCTGLLCLPSLACLDLHNNQLDDADLILPFFSQLTTLSALYLKGNPAIRHLSNYRRHLTSSLPCLSQLDDRPVSTLDHTLSAAFARGGVSEERKVKEEISLRKL